MLFVLGEAEPHPLTMWPCASKSIMPKPETHETGVKMATNQTLLVNKKDLKQTRIVSSELPPLKAEHVRLAIGKFSLTANNVTYGVFGDIMQYWNFFPSDVEGFGCVPVWGFGEVIESQASGVEIGTRVYGYFPMAQFLDVAVVKASPHSFQDGAAHRQPMAVAYNRYEVVAPADSEVEGRIALLKPLFMTGFLLDDWISGEKAWGAGQVIASSASSKTALAMAACLKKRGQMRLVGLTSARSKAFVEASGYYGDVVTYEEIGTMAIVPSVYVDFAGDGALTRCVHETFADALTSSVVVGGSHWDAKRADDKKEDAGRIVATMPGPKPDFFFAPTHMGRLGASWGGQAFSTAVNSALDRFVHDSRGWLGLNISTGLDNAQSAWARLLGNQVGANEGIVITL